MTIRGSFADPDPGTLEEVFGPAVAAAALVAAKGISEASPVRTGALRDSWLEGTPPPVWTGPTTLGSAAESAVPYAHYQETRTVNAGYVERGLEAAGPAVEAVKAALVDTLRHLWRNG